MTKAAAGTPASLTSTLARIALILAGTAAAAFSQAAPPAGSVLDQVRAHQKGLAVWWVGNAGWLIKSDGLLIATDLDLETDEKVQAPPITAKQLAGELDVLFVTHHHGDHCNIPTIRTLLEGSRTTVVLPRPCLKEASKLPIPKARLIIPEPLQPFEVKGIRVEPLHAIHGNQEF